MPETQPRSPYQGLIPYDEEDAPFFFGREKETRLIAANLFAAPLTLLYGASGVGKSSVLRAGVVHQLRPREDLLLVVFAAWQSDPVGGLKAAVAEAGACLSRESVPLLDSTPLAEYLAEWAARLDRRVMIILDQFEEYFLYQPQDDAFSTEFPHAVTQAELPVTFLVSMREDSLAKLDRFEGRIPNLFDNYLRIEHLGREAARAAIEKPIEQFNRLRAATDRRVRIEPALVEAVLDQVRTGQVIIGKAGRGGVGTGSSPTPAQVQIETPYLQLVMTRLWDEEVRSSSDVLRLETLNRLGGAERIVRTHLDGVMDALPSKEQEAAARVFHHLVTPGGTKIAHTVSDLADYASLPQAQLVPMLDKLSGAGIRILRPVAPPLDHPAASRYEIFHDVLAPAVLDWRARYVHARERARERRRRRIRMLQVMAGVLSLFSIVSYWAYSLWLENRPWGYVRNLSTGTVRTLKDDSVSFGRSATGLDYENTIDLRPRVVSRIHLLISRNLSAVDMRSFNGTTVNGEFLPYGDTTKLANGDIIVLADVAPFQFQTIDYSPFQFWTPSIRDSHPPSGWGILIDEGLKAIQYLEADKYFVALGDRNQIILQKDKTDNSLLILRKYAASDRWWVIDDGRGREERVGLFTIEDRDDGIDLFAAMKMGDYTYRACKIPAGKEFHELEWRLLRCVRMRGRDDYRERERERHAIFQAIFQISRLARFRIIPRVPNLEPPKSARR